jgi:hypothetical protein
MPSPEDIANQRERLADHRQNVQTLLKQIGGHGGFIHAPLAQLNTLRDQRAEIARCKATLRSWGQVVEDHPDDEATEGARVLDQQISELEVSLHMPLPEAACQPLEQALQAAQERRKTLEPVQGTVNIGGNAAGGLAIGVNFGVVVQQFFGRRLPEDGSVLLNAYLDALIKECDYLRLSRLTGRRQTGGEQGAVPALRLQAVYTSLTTEGTTVIHERRRKVAWLRRLVKRLERTPRGPDDVSPEQVRQTWLDVDQARIGRSTEVIANLYQTNLNQQHLDDIPDHLPFILRVIRPELVLEAIQHCRRLVLLGEPGSGKSTALRYVALLLAQRLRSGTEPLPGWSVDALSIPIFCPLGQVAAALSEHEGDATKALDQVLGDLLEGEQGQCAGLRDHLKAALRGEGVLLLFDGLDELPAEAPEGGLSPRVAVTEAIRRLERWTRARIVVTSRVLPYRTARDWQLPADEGWQVRTIQPLAFGQVQTFVTSWYAALAGTDPELPLDTAEARAEALTDELADSPALRPLIASPLLLTMLAILHYNTDEVPRDRARLYEECVQLLLERWEPVRTPGLRRPGLLERLGNVPGLELDLLRGTIHELAFKAHSDPPGDDGRGVIDGDALHGRMLKLFRAVRSAEPDRAVATFEQVLREDAGLLQARADGHYAFPHLTFQEYLAACYLANQPQTVELAQARWHSPDAERWREVLRLLVGRLRQQGKVQDKVLPWLEQLIAERVGKQVRPIAERRRDAVLATLVYRELGEGALASSTVDLERRIEAPLREALVALLAEHDPAITTADRVQAGFLLGELGDPRMPVTVEDWKEALRKLHAGDAGYFCRVEPGRYWIGSADDDLEADEEEKPRHQVTFDAPFWIGRFPITNAQWQVWVEMGGQPSHFVNDTELNRQNQPIAGVTWKAAVDFCTWLSGELGAEVRLPHETEWETAARGLEGRRFPWGDEWVKDWAATEEDQGIRGWPYTVPVGCYPAGVAGCGALDMAGNVWEWTADVWHSYPRAKRPFAMEMWRTLRGGSYGEGRKFVRCGARDKDNQNQRLSGFRVLVPSVRYRSEFYVLKSASSKFGLSRVSG